MLSIGSSGPFTFSATAAQSFAWAHHIFMVLPHGLMLFLETSLRLGPPHFLRGASDWLEWAHFSSPKLCLGPSHIHGGAATWAHVVFGNICRWLRLGPSPFLRGASNWLEWANYILNNSCLLCPKLRLGPSHIHGGAVDIFTWAHCISIEVLSISSHRPMIFAETLPMTSFGPITFSERCFR